MEIKHDYINKFQDQEKSFSKWLLKLNNDNYNTIFESLQTNQDENLLLIRYGLAEMQSGMWEDKNSIYRECRSVVIDLENEELVITPFRKFFNLNEVKENNIDKILEDITKAKVFEITNKLDGSMQSARYYNDKIILTGSMALNPKDSWRLQDGYSMLTENHIRMIKENPTLTFIFEYISMSDAHVVLYKKEQEGLYLIGCRDINTGYELSYKKIKICSDKYNVPMTDIELITITEVLSKMKEYKINLDGINLG
jgi:tRNA splicing ligase